MGGSGTHISSDGPPRGYSACDSLSFDTVLTSPVAAVVASLRVGDILPLELVKAKKADTVEAYTNKGIRAGSVNGFRVQELIKCMKAEHAFVAEVVGIDGGMCKVCISHR